MQADSPAPMLPAARPGAARPLPRRYSRGLIGGVIVLAGTILGLWLLGTPPGLLGKADAVGYAICHRIPARSFHAYGRALPLCARCTGIYLGVMAALGYYAAHGRLGASRLPGWKISAALLLCGVIIGVDGANSYLSLFEGYHPLYAPSNTLRLLTGVYAGAALISLVLPVLNATLWQAPQPGAPLRSLRDLAGLYLLAGGVGALVLLRAPALLVLAGLVSTAGVVLMFTIVGSVGFLTVTRRENTLRRWPDLILPALSGLAFGIAVIGLIDLARYLLTGTWDGLTLFG